MDRQLREDYVFLRRMRQPDFGVLVDISDEDIRKVAAHKGTVKIDCPDADQQDDLYTWHSHVCGSTRHHPPSLNGGALLLSQKGPSAFHTRGTILLEDALEGCKLKNIDTLVLYGHWPCGKAKLSSIRIDRAFELYADGKHRARTFFRDNGVKLTACCLWMHVDWPDEKKRSYFFNRKAWESVSVAGFRSRWREEQDFREKCVKNYWHTYWPDLAAA